jgi:hypothetical protein
VRVQPAPAHRERPHAAALEERRALHVAA